MAKKVGLLVCCAVLTLAAAAAGVAVPSLLFRAQDGALLGTHEYPTGTGTLELPLEELAPVLATLYNIEDTADAEITYLDAEDTEAADELMWRLQSYHEALLEAGVLPVEMFNYLTEDIEWDASSFSHSIDSAGVERIHVYSNTRMSIGSPAFLAYTIDISTNLVVGIDMFLPYGAPYLPGDIRGRANAWLQYLGLEDAGGWAFFGESAEEKSYQGTGATARGLSEQIRAECLASWSRTNINQDAPEYAPDGTNSLVFRLNTYRNWPDERWEDFNILKPTQEAVRGESG